MGESIQPENNLKSSESPHASTPASVYEDCIHDPEIMDLQQKIEEYKKLRENINAAYDALEASKTGLSSDEYNTKREELIRRQKEEQDKLSARFGFDINQLPTKYQDALNKNFGFDDGSVYKTADKYKEYIMQSDGEEHDSDTKYLPVISVILKTFKGNLEGLTIVEVGPGTEGVSALRFFQSLGATVVGIDNNSNTETEDGIVRHGSWNELSRFVDVDSADVIFTHHMTPVPETGTPFENDRDGFYRKCYTEMNACLKSGGILLGHQIEADSGIADPKFYGIDGYTPIKLVETDRKREREKGRINLIIKK